LLCYLIWPDSGRSQSQGGAVKKLDNLREVFYFSVFYLLNLHGTLTVSKALKARFLLNNISFSPYDQSEEEAYKQLALSWLVENSFVLKKKG